MLDRVLTWSKSRNTTQESRRRGQSRVIVMLSTVF